MEINFDSILNTKKDTTRKREGEYEEPVEEIKREHVEEDSEEQDIDLDDLDLDNLTKEDIDKMLEEADKIEAPRLDISGIKQMLLDLEKAINKNQELRLKYAADPLKFEDSEYALHEQLKKCSVFATESTVYPTLVKLDFVSTLAYLLSHDNVVISTDVVGLLDDLTDEKTILEDTKGHAFELVDDMVSKEIPKILISNLSRLDRSSPTQRECIESTLNTLDHLLEFHTELVDVYWSQQLHPYLLTLLEDDSFDDLMLHASEILFSLMSYTNQLSSLASQPDWIEKILVLVSRWRNHDPDSLQESEIVENIFNVLCLLLEVKECLPVVREKEGMDLLLIPIRKHKYARIAAFKALDYLLGHLELQDAQSFIDKKGLKYVFPALLGKNNGNTLKKWDASDKQDFENHILNILVSLLHIDRNSIYYKRILKKFHEDDYEKCDCILEIGARYLKKKQEFDTMVTNHKFDPTPDEEANGVTREEKEYTYKISEGLHVLDNVMNILKHLLLDEPCKWHIERKIYEQGWDYHFDSIDC